MATFKTEGIVIGRHDLGEADRILVILTPGKGVIRAVTRGVKRIKSRMAGHVEPFCRTEFMIAEGKSLDVVTSARLTRNFNVTKDYEQMRQAFLFGEMTNRLSGEEELHSGEFELLSEALERLEAGEGGPMLELWFKLRLLEVLGYKPGLESCVICRRNDESTDYFLSPTHGGLVDRGCHTGSGTLLSAQQIKLWRLMLSHDFSTLARVNGAGELSQSSLAACNQFYDHVFGTRFKSAQTFL
jgi:DNA repair protein RecO (recombination protein O)